MFGEKRPLLIRSKLALYLFCLVLFGFRICSIITDSESRFIDIISDNLETISLPKKVQGEVRP